MVNIARMPPCSGADQPAGRAAIVAIAMVQVGEAWMPSLCSIEAQRRSLRLPSGSTLGTRNSEMPRVPTGASGVRPAPGG
jgi:hypothetical protein